MGQVIGATDSRAEHPISQALHARLPAGHHVPCAGHRLHHPFYDPAHRPLPVLNEGRAIEELI